MSLRGRSTSLAGSLLIRAMHMHVVAKPQQMADEGLVQFLVLAKGAKGAACSALIQQVLNNKKIFVFGELLAMPNVQAVSV